MNTKKQYALLSHVHFTKFKRKQKYFINGLKYKWIYWLLFGWSLFPISIFPWQVRFSKSLQDSFKFVLQLMFVTVTRNTNRCVKNNTEMLVIIVTILLYFILFDKFPLKFQLIISTCSWKHITLCFNIIHARQKNILSKKVNIENKNFLDFSYFSILLRL